MNIALEKTEEYVNGKLRRNYGDAFVRGNNGLLTPSCIPIPSGPRRISDRNLQYCTSLPVDPRIHCSMLLIAPTYENLQVDKKDTL
jgi:hypothetical protein